MFAAAGDMTGSFRTIGFAVASQQNEVSLSRVFRLGKRLPAVRLPAAAELAALARTAPLMVRLEALASWLGQDGRPVAAAGELLPADAAEAARVLGIGLEYLPYLWEYALTARWVEFKGGPGEGQSRAVPGFTAWRWASGDDVSTLRAWAAVFAAVAPRRWRWAPTWTRRRREEGEVPWPGRGRGGAVVPRPADRDDRVRHAGRGPGRRARRPEVRARQAAMGRLAPRPRRPGALAARRARRAARCRLPADADGTIALAPLALWALREQLRLEGIEIPQITATKGELRAADLVALADSVPEAEFEAEVGAWVTAHGADRAARDLLAFAAFSGPQLRLVAVNLTRRLGSVAWLAWRDALQRPELRGYARIALSALAADLPESTVPLASRRSLTT